MKRTNQVLALLLGLALTMTLLTACGGSADGTASESINEGYDADFGYFGESETVSDSFDGAVSSTENGAFLPADGAEAGSVVSADPTEKMVYTAEVYAQTLDYDAAVTALKAAVAKAGGYIENYSVSNGGSYYSSSYYEGGGRRSADYTIRVPAAQFESFLSGIAAEFNVIDQNLYSENVTLQYVDLESRIKSLTTQQERLLELLAEAENLDQILAIENQLTETRADIESLTSSLRVLESRVSYSTVTLYISETTVYTPGAQAGFGQLLLRSFGSSWEDLVDGGRDLALYLASNFLQLLIAAAVIFLLWRVLRRKGVQLPKLRRKKTKTAEKTESEEQK